MLYVCCLIFFATFYIFIFDNAANIFAVFATKIFCKFLKCYRIILLLKYYHKYEEKDIFKCYQVVKVFAAIILIKFIACVMFFILMAKNTLTKYTRWVQKVSRILCSKRNGDFCVFSKNFYLFMNIYFVSFKVIPTRYYTLVPTFFSNRQKSIFVILFSSSFDAVFISSSDDWALVFTS